MGRAIIKIRDKLFLWSTVVDAPITYGLTREEMREHLLQEAMEEETIRTDKALDLAEKTGTSVEYGYKRTVEDIIKCNRAGKKGKALTIDEIYEAYAEAPEEEEDA